MCAIAGLWEARPLGGEALETKARVLGRCLAHRGPDDEGYWFDVPRGVALAHRRLSILDLSPAGHQPMISRSGRYVIVFNGEIYNFEEIRQDLIEGGCVLRGHSDTEVILEAFAQLGIDPVVQRMAGMFAIALWDRETAALTLIRDRVGKKPLYYGTVDGAFVFASELKAFQAVRTGGLPLDRAAIGSFLQLGYIPGPATVFEQIRKLPAGHGLTLKTPAEIPPSVPYWTVQRAFEAARASGGARTEEEARDEFEALLKRCVGQRMIADVPLGAFLSGGIDSSLVVALMQAQASRRVRTFSIAFEEPEFNEGPQAKMVARHLGTDHTELTVTAREALDLIPRLPEIYDEPFADASQIPTCLLCQLTRRHVTVALSGDGGDELFLGYAHYPQAARRIDRMMSVPLWARRAAAAGIQAVPELLLDTVCKAARGLAPGANGIRLRSHYVLKYAHALSQKTSLGMYLAVSGDWFNPESVLQPNGRASGADLEATAGVSARASVELFGLCDLAIYIPDDILVKVDRASMAWGLEARAPLLDHRLVEFALGLPVELKRRQDTGKWLMRQLLSKYVPAQIVLRPKQGFSVPVSQWLRGPLRDWAAELLHAGRMAEQGLLKAQVVRQRWEEHLAGKHDWGRLLWTVVTLQAWLQRWPSGMKHAE